MKHQNTTSKFHSLLSHFTDFWHLNVFGDKGGFVKENWVLLGGDHHMTSTMLVKNCTKISNSCCPKASSLSAKGTRHGICSVVT